MLFRSTRFTSVAKGGNLGHGLDKGPDETTCGTVQEQGKMRKVRRAIMLKTLRRSQESGKNQAELNLESSAMVAHLSHQNLVANDSLAQASDFKRVTTAR